MHRTGARLSTRPAMRVSIALIVLQVVAGGYFLIDGIDDAIWQPERGYPLVAMMEALVAVALLAGIVLSAANLRRLLGQIRRQAVILARARGAFAELVEARFQNWQLSAAEADVALFALKGLTIGEIAALRNAATGTVRSQLSQVYGKAGVSSQPMLIALFVDDLLATDSDAIEAP